MNLNKILKRIINIGIFLVPFIPLVITSTFFFPYISGKNFLFRIIVEIIFCAWAILAIRDKDYRPKFSWILVSIASFVAIIGIADLFGANPLKSFWSNFERMEGWITLIHLLGYFLVVGLALNTQKLWTKFLNTMLGASMIVAGYGILQLLGVLTINQGGVRLDATFGNATYLAIYMVLNIFIAAMFLVRRLSERYKKGEKISSFKWQDWIYLFVMLIQLFILYHTATRGAILGLIGGMIVTFILFIIFDEKGGILRKISSYKLVILLVLILGFFAVKNTEMIKRNPTLSRIASISINEATSARFPVWNMALKGFKEKPILGWGQESFNYVFNKNYEPKMYGQEQWFDRAHNIFLDWLVAGGFLGLLSYLSMFFVAIFFLWRKNEHKIENKKNKFESGLVLSDKVLLTGLFSAYFFNNIFVFDNIVSYILFFSLLAYIHTFNVREKEENNKPVDVHNDWMKGVGVTFILILTLFSIYFFNVRGMMVGANMIGALQNANNPAISIGYFEKALGYGYLGRPEVREQLIQTSASYATANIDLNLKQKFFDLASGEMTKQIQEDPENTRYEVFLGVFFNRYRVYDNAITHLERALVLSPNKQSTMFELGASYLNKNEREKALVLLKNAFELDKSYLDARKVYAVAAIYNGEDKLTEELLIPEFKTVLVPDEMIIKAYFDTNQFGKVISIEREEIPKNPTNIQNRLYLISSYLKLGRPSEAIKEVENAIEAVPAYKEQGEKVITEIRSGLYK